MIDFRETQAIVRKKVIVRSKSRCTKTECQQLRQRSSNQPSVGSNARNYQTNPAILVGLAMAFCNNSGRCAVPGLIFELLDVAAQNGCGASHMVLAWLEQHAKLSRSALRLLAALAVQNRTPPHRFSILGGHHG